MSELEFLPPIEKNGRLYFARSHVERYKRCLIHRAMGLPGEPEPVQADVECLVPADTVARELGISRRTLGRYIAGHSSAPKIAEAVG